MDIVDQKTSLRTAAKTARTLAHAKHGERADQAIANHGIAFANPPSGCVVSGFLPIRNELDPQPLMSALKAQGYTTALPVMVGKDSPLVFRSWASGEPLDDVVWGIKEPPATAPDVLPDVLLVPLLAYDVRGYRIGYGGGFYDRSIEQLRALKNITTIGLAFDEQQVDAVPHDNHDEPLDWMLTPIGPMRCTG